MTRRYGAAGTIGLGVAPRQSPYRTAPSTMLAGPAAWFFVQGGAALAGLLGGSVSTLTLFAAFADLWLGIGALIELR